MVLVMAYSYSVNELILDCSCHTNEPPPPKHSSDQISSFGLKCDHPPRSLKPIVEARISNVILLEYGVLKVVFKVSWGHKERTLINSTGILVSRNTKSGSTAERRMSASQGGRPLEKPNMPIPWFWTFNLRSCEYNMFLSFKPPSL
jgi:hypothetical protein